MIEVPWQIVVATIASVSLIIVSLVMQLRDRADRQTQRDNETVRNTARSIREGYEAGQHLFLQLVRNQRNENDSDPGNDVDIGDDPPEQR